jgi:chromosome segregation ATPase
MIEPIMFFGIGFLVASLLGLVFIPLVHNRAVRLTKRRIEAATPMSMAEIQADKDQLRAEHAMSTRRLELLIEQMKSQTASQLADLGKKSDAVNLLKVELGEKNAAIGTLEAIEQSLTNQLRATEAELAGKTGTLAETERMLAEQQAERAKLAADLDERSITSDSQRIDIVTLQTQVELLNEQIANYRHQAKETDSRLASERESAKAVAAELNEERAKAETLSDRLVQLERALVMQTSQAEALGQRVQELEDWQVDQMNLLSEREIERSRLLDDIAAREKRETELRTDLTAAVTHGRLASEKLVREKAELDDQLAQSKAERTKLLQEIAILKREVTQSWTAERGENALLRERMNDIAAEIARITLALEGSESPIQAILTGVPMGANGPRGGIHGERKPAAGAGENKGSLADRIRALQNRVPRMSAPN